MADIELNGLMAALTPSKLRRLEKLYKLEGTGLQWLSVHGALCLALRHPGLQGAPRKLLTDTVAELCELFVAWGIFSAEEMRSISQIESEESPHGD